MRLFKNCMEAIKEIERDLYEMGTEVWPESMQDIKTAENADYRTKELMGYTYVILDGTDRDNMLEYMGLPLDYALMETYDRLDFENYPLNPGNSWELRREVWEQFLHKGKFSYTYNERLHCLDQVDKVIEELEIHPNSRQAIVQIYDFEKDLPNWGGKHRVPCSILYQLMIRDKKLHLHYYQRSGDFLTHLAYDIWFALDFKEYVAGILNIEPGPLHHYVTSLHAYYKDLKARGIF